MRCRRPQCRCDHQTCVAGWIDETDENGKDWARPCEGCRPDRLPRRGEERVDWLARIRDEDSKWAKKYAA